ncbi:MAG: hypothetical protein EOM80_18780, partial [Erysipelotrichia bacterium]|nr:hypothetical protein [Erysipelotrichia bacterium]
MALKNKFKGVFALIALVVLYVWGCGSSGGSSSGGTLSNPLGVGSGVGVIRGRVYASGVLAPANITIVEFSSKNATPSAGIVSSEALSGLVPISGANVWVEELPGINAISATDGSFVLEGVPEGSFRVIAKYADMLGILKARSSFLPDISYVAPTSVDLNLLRATVRVKGTLTGVDGLPIPAGTKLMLWGETFEVGLNGYFETPPLPEGYSQVTMIVQAGYGQTFLSVPLTFVPGDNLSSIELTMPVNGATGEPIADYSWQPPLVSLFPEMNGEFKAAVRSGDQLTITARTLESYDISKLSLVWSANIGVLQETANPYVRLWKAPDFGGLATIKVIATNQYGATGTVSLPITVEGIPSSEKTFSAFAFVFPPTEAIIDNTNHTIAITVPFGTDVKNLVAVFSTSGQSVLVGNTSQKSGETANDFTQSLDYIVVAADGSRVIYRVSVTVAPEPPPQQVVAVLSNTP